MFSVTTYSFLEQKQKFQNKKMRRYLLISISMVVFLMMINRTKGVMQVYDFPNENNFFLSDITYYDLNTKFALFLKQKYLGESKQNFKPIVNGSMLGMGRRSFIILPVRLRNPTCQKSLNVIFKIDTGVTNSTISRQVTDALYGACPQLPKYYNETYEVQINQQLTKVTQTILPLQIFNTLGADYLLRENIELIIHYQRHIRSTVQMRFW